MLDSMSSTSGFMYFYQDWGVGKTVSLNFKLFLFIRWLKQEPATSSLSVLTYKSIFRCKAQVCLYLL